jgi:hypothetical protein
MYISHANLGNVALLIMVPYRPTNSGATLRTPKKVHGLLDVLHTGQLICWVHHIRANWFVELSTSNIVQCLGLYDHWQVSTTLGQVIAAAVLRLALL